MFFFNFRLNPALSVSLDPPPRARMICCFSLSSELFGLDCLSEGGTSYFWMQSYHRFRCSSRRSVFGSLGNFGASSSDRRRYL